MDVKISDAMLVDILTREGQRRGVQRAIDVVGKYLYDPKPFENSGQAMAQHLHTVLTDLKDSL